MRGVSGVEAPASAVPEPCTRAIWPLVSVPGACGVCPIGIVGAPVEGVPATEPGVPGAMYGEPAVEGTSGCVGAAGIGGGAGMLAWLIWVSIAIFSFDMWRKLRADRLAQAV